MEMTRVSVPLTIEEREQLRLSAQKALRHPREQARYILRSVLLGEQVQENNKPATASNLEERTASESVTI